MIAEAEKLLSGDVVAPTAEAVSRLRDRYAAAKDRIADKYDAAKEQVLAQARMANETIRSRPYESVAVAAGAGLLVGLIIGHNRR
ncbi:MAG TPA: hypothetical protein VHE13_16970 [Opitutus sp.]|nr:hypothetical protein [Opitutus sp.]